MNHTTDHAKPAVTPVIPEGYEDIVVTGNLVKPAAESSMTNAIAEALKYARSRPDETILLETRVANTAVYDSSSRRKKTLDLTAMLKQDPDLEVSKVFSALYSQSHTPSHQR